MRKLLMTAAVLLAGCASKPSVVNVTVVNTVSGADSGVGAVTVTNGLEMDEGTNLDLVIGSDPPGATITAGTLPKNAVFANGVFSFAPDYSQAGLYDIAFTSSAGGASTTRTVAIRVFNVIHIVTPPLTSVSEGSRAPDIAFSSDDPAGTTVTYSADVSEAPGEATFDPLAKKLSFAPSWRWLDSKSPTLTITVTAQGQEIDSGKTRTSTAQVVYQISEATSFSQELVPLFLLPLGSTSGLHPDWESAESHNCLACHDGSGTSPAGIDFHPASIFAQLVSQDVAPDNINGSTCHSLAASGVKRVVPNDLSKSLWYMKISGTDGSGNPGPPCGVQDPINQPWNWWTVTSQAAWTACPIGSGGDQCREALDCLTTAVTCKSDAALVRKARLWILAGAPNN